MKRLMMHYKLVLLDSISIVLIFISGLALLFNNITALRAYSIYTIGGIIPVSLALLLIILDVGYIANYKDIREKDFEPYRKASRIKRNELLKIERRIRNIIKIISIIVIIFSIIMAVYMKVSNLSLATISYTVLLVVAACHFYTENKKV